MTTLTYTELQRLLQRLGSDYVDVSSSRGVFDRTVDLAADVLEADVFVIAEKSQEGLSQVASMPREWEDADDLLSPVSLPSILTSEGVAYLIGDRGDVRGAAATESLDDDRATIEYRSVLIAPFGETRVLLAGAREPAAFSEHHLEILRLLGDFAGALAENAHSDTESQQSRALPQAAAAGLSHDATNFLSVIEGRVEIAREDPSQEHFDAIERASERLGQLIDDTATLFETGSHAPDTERVDLQAVVSDAWDLERTDEAEIVMAPLESIRAEPSRLSQLLENLFRNAIQHAGPDVSVWVGMLSEGEGFYVEDDGPGIEPEERESVLEFAYSNRPENTGLGLSIVQWIAAAHGWEISITDGAMGGTRFEFRDVDVVS